MGNTFCVFATSKKVIGPTRFMSEIVCLGKFLVASMEMIFTFDFRFNQATTLSEFLLRSSH